MDPDALTPEELKELVSRHDDERIMARCEQIGVEKVLDRVFAEMAERFQPDKAGDTRAEVQFTISDHAYVVRIADGACVAGRGKADDERVGMMSSLPTFLKLITGVQDGMMAVLSGKLKVRGDMMFAPRMLAYFDRP